MFPYFNIQPTITDQYTTAAAVVYAAPVFAIGNATQVPSAATM